MRRLIFNADDYGLSRGVSSGIREAHSGVVHSTTVMANLVAAEDIKALTGTGMSPGLHLNLSCGPPLTGGYPRQLLKTDGMFDKARAIEAGTWQRGEYHAAVVAEWEAQLSRLTSSGLMPDHVDSHHHTHLLTPLFPLALEFALRHGLALRTRQEQSEAARRAGVATPDGFVETYFGYNKTSRVWLMSVLAGTTGEVVEVMCHPGKTDPALERVSSYRLERETELAVLGDKALVAELEVQGWQVADYRAVQ